MGKFVEEQGKDSFPAICSRIYNGIIGIAILVVLIGFPMYYQDYYFNILEAKYSFYYCTMLAFFAVMLLVTLAFVVVDALEFQRRHTKAFLQKFAPGNIRRTLSASDWFLLAFLVICIISTMQSDYVYESFWGNEGRYTGLFLHLIYIVGFFIIAHLYKFKPWHVNIFLAAAMLLLLFGITDYFKLDLLGFKADIAEQDINDFTSTFGNVNTYATYVGIVFGCLSALFVSEKKPLYAFFYFIGLTITVFAMITGNSDNAFLALGVVLAFLPFYAFLYPQGVERYLILLADFFTAAAVIRRVRIAIPEHLIYPSGIFRVLTEIKAVELLSMGLWLLAAAAFVFRLRQKAEKKETLTKTEPGSYKKKALIWGIFLLICIVAGMYILYDVNLAGNTERYGSLGAYLRFSDEWGTFRGMIWRISVEAYKKQPLMHKLWGYGLDTFGLLVYGFREETRRISGQVFDSAHNEYLQYLVTAGLFGLIAYVGFFVTTLVSIVKKCVEQRWGMVLFFGIACYLAQATLTINLPIVTPIMWMLLSMAVAMNNDLKKSAENESAEK